MLLGSRQIISARPNTEGNLNRGLGPGRAWCTQGYSVEAAIKTCIGPLRLPDFGAHLQGNTYWMLNKQAAVQGGRVSSGAQAGSHEANLQQDRHNANRTRLLHRQMFRGTWTDLLLC